MIFYTFYFSLQAHPTHPAPLLAQQSWFAEEFGQGSRIGHNLKTQQITGGNDQTSLLMLEIIWQFNQMEERPRLSKHSFKISIESRKSIPSSCRSLERPSWCSRQKSLSKNHSLLDVMSLEGGRKSDIYDRMLQEGNQLNLGRQSLGGNAGYNYASNYQYNQFQNDYIEHEDVPQTLNQRRSEETASNIRHACGCYTDCEWFNCECFKAKEEICVKGFCCVGCIEMKQKLLLGIPPEKPVNPQNGTVVYCTCKKTKCNKKYCSCYAAGIHCGEKCSCEGCINCPRKSEHMQIEEEREQINEEALKQMEMPEGMDFQPVQFRFSNP